MRFFTPELFTKVNSSDEAVMDEADEEWEAAVEAYDAHIKKIRSSMPRGLKRLLRLHLHDAEFLGVQELQIRQPTPSAESGATALMTLRRTEDLVLLLYSLCGPIRTSTPIRKFPFYDEYVHWLYDEIDAMDEGGFIQHILLSDGRVMEIPLSSVIIQTVPLPAEAKQPA